MLELIELFNKEFDLTYNKKRSIQPVVVQIGVGATGSHLSQQLAQMLAPYGSNGYYCLADPDIVEDKNLVNQLFTHANVDQHKAKVLANRYASAYNIPVLSYTEAFIESVEDIEKLFQREYTGLKSDVAICPILIGCVDNIYSRQVMHAFYEKQHTLIYIDSGNEHAIVPSDFPQRDKEQWSDEEWKEYRESGWTGQVVCGMKIGGTEYLKPLGDVYPDILEDSDSLAPSTLSCEELSQSDPQRLMTNKMASIALASYLSEIIETQTISKHHTVFHAKKAYIQSHLLE